MHTGQKSLDMYCQRQAEDPSCSETMEYTKSGWQRKQLLQHKMIHFWKFRSSFTVYNNYSYSTIALLFLLVYVGMSWKETIKVIRKLRLQDESEIFCLVAKHKQTSDRDCMTLACVYKINNSKEGATDIHLFTLLSLDLEGDWYGLV